MSASNKRKDHGLKLCSGDRTQQKRHCNCENPWQHFCLSPSSSWHPQELICNNSSPEHACHTSCVHGGLWVVSSHFLAWPSQQMACKQLHFSTHPLPHFPKFVKICYNSWTSELTVLWGGEKDSDQDLTDWGNLLLLALCLTSKKPKQNELILLEPVAYTSSRDTSWFATYSAWVRFEKSG